MTLETSYADLISFWYANNLLLVTHPLQWPIQYKGILG